MKFEANIGKYRVSSKIQGSIGNIGPLVGRPTVKRFKPIFHWDAKPFALGPGVGLDPQRHNFVLEIPTCWYPKTIEFALPQTQTVRFVLPPKPTLNASRWNIGGVGSLTKNSRIGHVDFMLFVSILFALGSQCEPSIQWNMGLREFSTYQFVDVVGPELPVLSVLVL